MFILYILKFWSRWSEAECVRQQLPVTPENQRQVLGNALSLVRFPLMSKEEFTAGPAQSGLLNYSEASVTLWICISYCKLNCISERFMPRNSMGDIA